MKRLFILTLAVLGLPVIGKSDSKAQGFSITFGDGPDIRNLLFSAGMVIGCVAAS